MTSADHGNLFLQKKLNGIKDEFKSQQNQAIQLQNIFDIESIQVEVLRTEISSNINIKSFQPSFSLQLGNQIKFNATNQYRDPYNAIFNEFFEFDCCNLQQMNKLFMKLYHVNQLPPQQSPSQFQNKILIGQAALDVLTVQSQQTIKKQIVSQDNAVIGYVYYKVQFRHQIKNGNQNINHAIQKQLNEQQNQSQFKQQQNNNPNNISPKHFSSRIKQIQQQDEGKKRMNTDNTMQTNSSKQNNPDKEYQRMLEQTDEDIEQLIDIQGHYKKKSFDDLESTKRRDLYPPFRQLNQANIKERGFSHAPEQTNQGHFQLYQQQLSQVPVSQFHSQKVNQANTNRMFKMFQNNSKQQKQQKQQPSNTNIPSNSQAHISNSTPLQNQQIPQQQQVSQQNQYQQLNNQQPILQQNSQQVLQKQPSEIMQQLTVLQQNQSNLKSQFNKNMEQQAFQQIQSQQGTNQLQAINNDQILMAQQSQLEIQKLQQVINDLKNKISYDEQRVQLALQNINQSRRQVEDERIALKVKNDFLIEKLKIIEKEQLQYQEFMKITNEEENIIQQQINVVAQQIKKKKKSLIIKRAEYKILQKQHENKIKKIDSYYERINDYQKELQKFFTINQKQRNKIENIKNVRKELQKEEIEKIQQKRRYSLQDQYSQISFQIEDADYIFVISPHENLSNLLDEKNEQRQLYLESIKEYQNQKEEYTHLIQMEQTVKEKLQNLQEKLSELGIQENNVADIGEDKNNQDQSRGSYTQIIDQQSVISAESEQNITQNHIYFRQNEEYQDQKEFQQQIRNMQIRQLLLEGNMQAYGYDYIKMAQGNNQVSGNITDSQANYVINNDLTNNQIDSKNSNNVNNQAKIPNILQIQSSQRPLRNSNNIQQQFGHSLHNLSLQNNLIQKQQIHQQQQSQQLQHTHSAIIPNHYELTFKNQNEVKSQHFSKFKDQFENKMMNQQNDDQAISNDDEILSDNNQQLYQNVNNFSSMQNQFMQYQKQFQNNQNNQQNDFQSRSKTPLQINIDGPSFEQHIQSVTARNSPRIGYNQQNNYHFQPIKSNEQLLQLQQVQNSSININTNNNDNVINNNNTNNNINNNLNNGNYVNLLNAQQTQNYQNAGLNVEEIGSVRNKINRFEQKSVDLIYTSQSPYSVLNQNDFALQQQQQQNQLQSCQQQQQQQKSATPVNKKNKSDLDQIQLITNFSKETFEDAASPEFLVAKNNNNNQNNISMNNSSNNNSYSNGRMLFTQIVGQAQQQQQQALQLSQNSNSSLNERDYFGRYSNKSFDNLGENFSQLQVFQQNSQPNNQQLNRGISLHENNQNSNTSHQNFIQQQQQQILQQQLLQQQQQQQHMQQIQNQQQQLQQQQQQLLQQNQIQQKQDLKSIREQYKAKQKNIQFVNQQQNNFISNNAPQNLILMNTSPTLFGKYFNDRASQQDQTKQ
ncbi:hypothetical protein TTHERM_00424690 (macronuclear) [Tetrahymena thermophila SB210]|uniref:C2 domain n=1 Tax=Tetrahymena thermophila (strain SB210) TaxID=312017 RepID=Q23AJ1_TETTS|nr:hypothetical protein TTHERM_00424690 [Tetrahymena thermophila SB210]EAR93501.2 hypothetical protein TTHERM_00424690 [Tetrahymena thermophila SB210]|eukprot:XP_001013746.2 hypothetical protein TTHERM_00424690 [Tetrahymena thermophila SB210]